MSTIQVNENTLIRNGWRMIGKMLLASIVPAGLAYGASMIVIGQFEGTVTTKLDNLAIRTEEIRSEVKELRTDSRIFVTRQEVRDELKVLDERVRSLETSP